ncbi:dynamin family protein [Actinoalloteichus hymeniacidonis]|uniref:Dynamin family protein n=1 Tax=Actinoalloteichus hymeniacidonis TaxID=340345 RepID=A0AAC9HVG0_9PSEU|nr:dynamin family protein [Actinoalloteichus hymeniacidonis]AOS66099.1 dynamin family protein [Actinoalloteichus hymeniacidonis]MBB5905797.1 GTPase SAR1 family protein [Actinoalloteichus hymeniacidonis]
MSAEDKKLPLPKLVRQTRERLVGILQELDPESAAWVEKVRTSRLATPSVVVVGETNRGKSSLVNALLNQQNLSPVDADVATATYLAFGHAPEWSARACYGVGAEPIDIAVETLNSWVSVNHELPSGALPPRYVEVDGPVELLGNLRIVDTPGVGGLNEAHGELAAEAAANATALLFVVDSSAPFTSGELAFLTQISDRVETVLFALTKTDQYRGWRQILEANRALLAEHAPRFTDTEFHPVSARMHQLAAQAPTEAAAGMLRERSGVSQLGESLSQLVGGRANMLGEANTMRALSSSLAALAVRLEAEQRALTVGEDEAETLRARRDELSGERRANNRGWQLRLRGEINRTRVECAHEVGRQVRDLQSWFRKAIDVADKNKLIELPQHVDAALQMLSSRVSGMLSDRLAKVADTALADLFSADELAMLQTQVARATRPPVVVRPPEKRPPTAEDRLLVFMGLSGGLGAGKLATLPLAPLAIAAPLLAVPAIVLGLGAGWWIGKTRKHTADKQHVKQWLTEAIADSRSTLDQLISEQLIEAELQLSLALDDALARRIAAIEDELREVEKALRMDVAERKRELQTNHRRLTEVTSGRDRVEELLRRIRDVRVRA